MVSHILSNGFTFLYITSNIRNFFIGAVIFIISGILLEKYIEELKCDGTNISSAG
ncbi:caax amino terminal protease family protein [Clostridium botulinum H04402 065]|nr:caax amino terminal protease family protein [Clostridium botulinum H04402 065]